MILIDILLVIIGSSCLIRLGYIWRMVDEEVEKAEFRAELFNAILKHEQEQALKEHEADAKQKENDNGTRD